MVELCELSFLAKCLKCLNLPIGLVFFTYPFLVEFFLTDIAFLEGGLLSLSVFVLPKPTQKPLPYFNLFLIGIGLFPVAILVHEEPFKLWSIRINLLSLLAINLVSASNDFVQSYPKDFISKFAIKSLTAKI